MMLRIEHETQIASLKQQHDNEIKQLRGLDQHMEQVYFWWLVAFFFSVSFLPFANWIFLVLQSAGRQAESLNEDAV